MIVGKSSECYQTTMGSESDYGDCCTNFCQEQCKEAASCRTVCSDRAIGLFAKFAAQQGPETRAALQAEAEQAAGEQADALADLRKAQSRMAQLNHRIAEKAAQEIRKGDVAKGKYELAKVSQLTKLQDQVSQHLQKVASFKDMARKSSSSSTEPSEGQSFLQTDEDKKPEDNLAQEMTHDLEMNFNKIAPFGKEDTAKELQDHAAKTQDTLVDAVENAEVAEIKRAVFRALTRLRAATIKEFDTIARLETQAIDAYNDAHHYRAENPLAHLHEDEAPVETDKLKSFH